MSYFPHEMTLRFPFYNSSSQPWENGDFSHRKLGIEWDL